MPNILFLTAAGELEGGNHGQNKWVIWTTPAPLFIDAKMLVFAPSPRHRCFRGMGDYRSTLFCPRFNLGQNEWEIWTTPPPLFNDTKMPGGSFLLLRACIVALGEGGGEMGDYLSLLFCPRLDIPITSFVYIVYRFTTNVNLRLYSNTHILYQFHCYQLDLGNL